MLKKLFLAIGFGLFTVFAPQFAQAEIDQVQIVVKGLTCPFCIYGLEKKLKALDEVEDIETNMKTGIVDIRLKQGESLNIERLNLTIRESDFTPGDIKIRATGRLTKYDLEDKEYPAIKVIGSDQVFLLVSTPNHEQEEFLSKERLNEIEKATEGGEKEITVTGHIHLHTKGIPPALNVESFEVK